MSLSPPSLPAVISPPSPSVDGIRFVGAAHPLKVETVDVFMPEGLTLKEMLEVAQPDPILLRDAVIFVDDTEIPREYWSRIRPKPGTLVTARVIPYMRGGGGGKNPLRTVLTLAVVAAAFIFAAPLGAALGFSTSAVIFGQTVNLAAFVGGTIITVAGTLAINAIAPVRPPDLGLSGLGNESPSLFLEGSRNQPRPFKPVPSLLGKFRYRPPLGAQTYTEILGDTNRLRMLLLPGLGEIIMRDWRIGNDSITNFEDYQIETRNGRSSDSRLNLYTNSVEQENFSILLESARTSNEEEELGIPPGPGYTPEGEPRDPAEPTIRLSGTNADELSIDITHPRGLTWIDNKGKKQTWRITFLIHYRKVGTSTWRRAFPAFWTAGGYRSVSGRFGISGAKAGAIRTGIRWRVYEPGAQYEVRVSRYTPHYADHDDYAIFDDAYWAAIRTMTYEDPIAMPVPVAKAALSIKASDQLNGFLDDISMVGSSVVAWGWSSALQAWQPRIESNNPADLFRHVLQGPGKAVPALDSEIDLPMLQEWHEFCVDHGFTFNMVRDFNASVWDTLSDIASAGRAGLDIVDGKWSVVIDRLQTQYATHITSRNSFGFQAERVFGNVPHAWRVRFPNEQMDYEQDERIVYREGYSAANATLFETLFFPGVTNPSHVWKLGRYHAAVAIHRPERWTVRQDFEYLVAKRGSLVKITHDVLSIGLSAGRISGLITNASGDIIMIEIDTPVEMEAGKSYGLVIRRDVDGNTSRSIALNTQAGTQTTLTLTVPVSSAETLAVGDLYGFGELGQETEDALVLLVEPENDISAKLTLVPYREDIYRVDSSPVPPYTPTITPLEPIPPVKLVQIISDESVLEAGVSDVALIRVEIQVEPIGNNSAVLEVQQRFTGSDEAYYPSEVIRQTKASITLGGFVTNEDWLFRIRWNDTNRLVPGTWTYISSHRIVGLSTPPAALRNPTISAFGGAALIRWEAPPELDVKFGGVVQFRHSKMSTSWSESVSIGQAAQARALFAVLPLKGGNYLARVFDSSGNKSDVISLNTSQASVLKYGPLGTITEAPSFSGVFSGTDASAGILKLSSNDLLEDISGTFDTIVDFDTLDGEPGTSGKYSFNSGFDFGEIKRVRLTTDLESLISLVNDSLDARPNNVDNWQDWDGTDQAEADVQVWVRQTRSAPIDGSWSSWERLDSAEFEARGFEFECRLTTNDSAYNILVSELGVIAEEVTA